MVVIRYVVTVVAVIWRGCCYVCVVLKVYEKNERERDR